MKTTRAPLPRAHTSAVTILELMVAVSLISFIILALYGMFDRTQAQMRRAVRETDKFESGRSVTDIIRKDLAQLGYVKNLYESGAGAIATNWTGLLAPLAYNPATTYAPGSVVNSGGNSYFALTTTVNNNPATSPTYWDLAAPNLRISTNWSVATQMAMQNASGALLQSNFVHDLFFMYFDPDLRTTPVTAGSIAPGVSYLATSATATYNGTGYPMGTPFYGVTTAAGAPVASLGGGTAVRVEGGWRAVGYRLASSTNALYPLSTTPGIGSLYRYELGTYGNDARRMWIALANFAGNIPAAQTNVFRRIADNVVHFRCRAVSGGIAYPTDDTDALFFGTNLPSHVEVELGILDARVAAQTMGMAANLSTAAAYLAQQGDAVQLFRLQIPVRVGQ